MSDESVEALPPKPILRVVKGDLTSEELAALVAVIAARNAAAAHAAARVAKRPRERVGPPRPPRPQAAPRRTRSVAPFRLGLRMPLRAMADLSPADWFVEPAHDWQELVSIGPPGYEAYVRVLYDLDDESERDVNGIMIQAVRDILAHHTSTPDDCYIGWWIGVGVDPPVPPAGPIFSITTWIDEVDKQASMRDYHLYAGTLADARDFEVEALDLVHLTWPADRAWFMAADTDPEWFGVGGPQAAIDELMSDPSINAVDVVYGEAAMNG